MIIDFYNRNGGGGSVPIATRDTAGIVKVGSGLTIDSGGTLSADGGAGGGGDYIVTEALSSITNPTEGMIAYVPAHYEDRGATVVTYTLKDDSSDVDFSWKNVVSPSAGGAVPHLQSYHYSNGSPATSFIEPSEANIPLVQGRNYSGYTWQAGGYCGDYYFRMLTGGTFQILIGSGVSIDSYIHPDISDIFDYSTSTGLTPIPAKTYIYLDNAWILKNLDFGVALREEIIANIAYAKRHQDIIPLLSYSIWNNKLPIVWFDGVNQGHEFQGCGKPFYKSIYKVIVDASDTTFNSIYMTGEDF